MAPRDVEGRAHRDTEAVTWTHLDRELGHTLDEIRHLRELWDTTRQMEAQALLLQADKYEARLQTLNHAHEQAIAEQARTLPRELFNRFEERWRDEAEKHAQDIRDIREQLARDVGRAASEADRSIFVTRFVMAAITILGLVWQVFGKH